MVCSPFSFVSNAEALWYSDRKCIHMCERAHVLYVFVQAARSVLIMNKRKRQHDWSFLFHMSSYCLILKIFWYLWRVSTPRVATQSVKPALFEYFKTLNTSSTAWTACVLVDLADIVAYFSIVRAAWVLTLFVGFSLTALIVFWCCLGCRN